MAKPFLSETAREEKPLVRWWVVCVVGQNEEKSEKMKRIMLAVLFAALLAPSAAQGAVKICEKWRNFWYAQWPDGSITWIGWAGDAFDKCVELGGPPPGSDHDGVSGFTGYEGGYGFQPASLADALKYMCDQCKYTRALARVDAQGNRNSCYEEAWIRSDDHCDGWVGRTRFTGEYSTAHCTGGYWEVCNPIKIYETNPKYTQCMGDNLYGKGTTSAVRTFEGGASSGGPGGAGIDITYGETTGRVDIDSSEGLRDWCDAQASADFISANTEYNSCRKKVNDKQAESGEGKRCY